MATVNPFGPMAGPASSPAPTAPAGAGAHHFELWGKDGFTFGDILDAINPLQQLPIVGTIYRHLTGQTISPASRIMGGALFGGPIGAAVSILNAAIGAVSGKGLGEQVLEALEGGGGGSKATVHVAAAAVPTSTFPSGRPPQAGATDEATVSRTQPHPRPGGWIINAACAAQGGRARPFPEVAARSARASVHSDPRQRPGGWIINAAYAAQGRGAQPLPEVAERSAQPSAQPRPRPRPGGWMVNAAYAGLDAAQRTRASSVSVSA